MKRPPSSRETGVALLTALLIVLALSSLSVAALEGLQRNRRLDANAASLAQARWYAIGAEAQVRSIAADLRSGGMGLAVFAKGPRVFTFPLEAGVMEIEVRDGSRCINLNGVVAGAGDILQRHEEGSQQLIELLEESGIPLARAEAAVLSLIDWIDTDDGRQAPGPDDMIYMNQSPPYLAAGQPLAEVSELRAIEGFTPDIYAAIRPHVCALPDLGPARVNLNALTPEDAIILTALSGGALPVRDAANIIAGRPAWGWNDVAQFMEAAKRAGHELSDRMTGQLDLDPRYLDLTINVVHLDADVALTEQLVLSGDRFRTVARRWSGEP